VSTRYRRAGAAFVVLVSALAATSVGATGGAVTSFTTTKIKAAGISVRRPTTWNALELTRGDVRAALAALERDMPRVAGAISGSTASLPGSWRFYAVQADQALANKPFGTLSVLVRKSTPLPANVEVFTTAIVNPTFGPVQGTADRVERVTIGGESGLLAEGTAHLQFPNGVAGDMRLGLLYLPHGKDTDIVTVSVVDGPNAQRLLDDIFGAIEYLR
jgi:hypothetical protein